MKLTTQTTQERCFVEPIISIDRARILLGKNYAECSDAQIMESIRIADSMASLCIDLFNSSKIQ